MVGLHVEDPWANTVIRDLAVGRTVGEYVIVRRIGEGGMGIVYEAEHPQIGRRVAIKVLRPDVGLARDLLGEARAVSAIRHRHIIDVFGFGELEGLGQYMVMDLLEGVTLDEEIRKKAPMTHDQVIPILDDTLAALSAAHAKGVIHRDLKPGNLFLVQESSGTRYVKVLDFGLAKATGPVKTGAPQTREGIAMGTPEYMAPEQAQAKSVDARTDLYSLGIIAFEMLTGRVPFSADSPLATAMKQVADAPAPPRSLEQSIPTALEILVLQLLSKNPNERPPSAEAVRSELKRIKRALATEDTAAGGQALRVPTPAEPQPAPVTRDTEREPVVLPTPQRRKAASLAYALGGGAAMAMAIAIFVVTRPGPGSRQQPIVEPAPIIKPPVVVEALPPKPDPQPVVDPEPVPAPVPVPVPVSPPPVPSIKSPRPAKRPNGTLMVLTRGCSMEVLIDGKLAGRTPHAPFPVPSGTHVVRVSNPLCTPPSVEKTIVIQPGEETPFEIKFRP